MRAKKVVLVLLLIFSIASLVLIVYLAKNKMGFFGKLYDRHVSYQTAEFGKMIKSNLGQIFIEVKALAEDNVVKTLFVSSAVGESSDKYSADFEKMRKGISGCDKIQAIDSSGKVVFSTLADEINAQKIKASFLDRFKTFFTSNENVYVYFIDKSQFVCVYPAASSTYKGYVALYYQNSRLLKGQNYKKVSIPFSYEDFMFLSSGKVDTNDINKILNFYSNPSATKKNPVDPTVGGISRFDGLKVVYYAKNDKFISPLTIVILLVNFLLLTLVTFALTLLMKEERMYREVNIGDLEKDVSVRDYKSKENIQGLVEDIENNEPFDEGAARQGIEDMILSNDIDLTSLPDDNLFKQEKEEVSDYAMPEFEGEEKMEAVPEHEFALGAGEDVSMVLDVPDDEVINTYEEIKPSAETDMFAEQDRILDGVDTKAFDNPVEDLELPAHDLEKPLDIIEIPEATSDFSITKEETEIPQFAQPEMTEMEFEVPVNLGSEETVPAELEIQEMPEVSAAPMDLEMPEMISLDATAAPELPADQEITVMEDSEHGVVIGEEISNLNVLEEPLLDKETETPVQVRKDEIEEIPNFPYSTEGAAEQSVKVEKQEPVSDVTAALTSPPERLSSISSVSDYGNVALDLAKNRLNIDKILVLEKLGEDFSPIINEGLPGVEFKMDVFDPIYDKFLSKRKSLNVRGDLNDSEYLKAKFGKDILDSLDEVLIVPIIKKEEIQGVAIYARAKGVTEPTNFQKSELYNLGFLQES